ncbi:ribosomal protein L4 [Lindgomyces ingoldianus]|uniref:Ribosomal protein L4 n=1 Tax=Lindgomyces ingoldianus TaxID=673940 RepID=A0ACB6R8F3_9PLEO|nr:ribosomal protein L4 [Lindgomyces ingoldianus]KAF2475073.1 ribosomal protein L4 [Lindgomyces ingoldianus]
MASAIAVTPFRRAICTRSITTSTSSLASVSDITASIDTAIPRFPINDTAPVHATIHHFPSLEPLRFQEYPANYLRLPTRRDILHRAVIFEGDNHRRGTASTKWRSEVHGSARKIRPQKGSGRARLGDKKSPMLRGGGVAFGPKRRDFSTDLPRRVYDLAWRTALSYRFKKGELVIVDNAMHVPKGTTMDYVPEMLRAHGWDNAAGRSLLVTLGPRPRLAGLLSGRHGRTLTWDEVDVKDLLELGRIVIERDALSNIFAMHRWDLHKNWNRFQVKRDLPIAEELEKEDEDELVYEMEEFDEDVEATEERGEDQPAQGEQSYQVVVQGKY